MTTWQVPGRDLLRTYTHGTKILPRRTWNVPNDRWRTVECKRKMISWKTFTPIGSLPHLVSGPIHIFIYDQTCGDAALGGQLHSRSHWPFPCFGVLFIARLSKGDLREDPKVHEQNGEWYVALKSLRKSIVHSEEKRSGSIGRWNTKTKARQWEDSVWYW